MAAGDADLPRDAKAIIAMLASLGVDKYEPRVIHQFLELYYRNAVDLLMDAKTYSNHAGKTCIDLSDVIFAINSKIRFSCTHPPREEVKEAARKVNDIAIPKAPAQGEAALPPERDTLIASNYLLEIQKKQPSETVEEQEVESDACSPKPPHQQKTNMLPNARQQVSFPLPKRRPR